MGIKLGDALVYLRGDSKPLEKDLAEGKKKTTVWTQAVGTAIGGLMSGAISGGISLATGAVKNLGKELLFLTMDAAKLESTSNTFRNLAESIGGDAAVAMEQLRTATRGMVADADLMQAGNKFLAMGLADTTEGAADLAEMATQLGMAMGEDATGSMENFALMMANQSIPRLDSFGISSSKVRERIKELMDATEGMTREAAFNQAVMEQGALTMKKVGEQAGTSAAKMAAMQATLANLKLKAGQALQPILDAIVSIGEALVEKYGPRIEEWLDRIKVPMQDIGEALKFLVDGDFNSFFGKLSDALVALGVPQEILDKIYLFFLDMGLAIQSLRDGDAEGFIQNLKQALYDLGVSEEFLGKLETAFWKIVDVWTAIKKYWVENLKPALIELFDTILKPALEGLMLLFNDLKPLLPIIGGLIFLWLVAPMLAAALPVIALGVALIALGLIWKEYGEQVKQTMSQVGVIVAEVFARILEAVKSAVVAITGMDGPFGDLMRTIFGDGSKAIGKLDEMIGKVREANAARAEEVAAMPAPKQGNMGQYVEKLQEIIARLTGGGNETNNMTNYGGIQVYPQGAGGNPLENLWNLGAA